MPFLAAAAPAIGAIGSAVGGAAALYGALKKPPGVNLNGLGAAGFSPAQTPFSQKLYDGRGGYGWVNIDPSIRNIRRNTLTRLPGYRSEIGGASDDYLSTLGGIKQEYEANMNPWMQARLNPLRQRIAQGRGELISGMSRRNIFGPLYSQGLANYDIDTSRAEADQTALATTEAQQARLGLNQQIYAGVIDRINQFRQLDQSEQAVVAQDLQQELAALGLGQADIGAAIQAAGLNMQGQMYADERFGRGLASLGNIFSRYGQSNSGGVDPRYIP